MNYLKNAILTALEDGPKNQAELSAATGRHESDIRYGLGTILYKPKSDKDMSTLVADPDCPIAFYNDRYYLRDPELEQLEEPEELPEPDTVIPVLDGKYVDVAVPSRKLTVTHINERVTPVRIEGDLHEGGYVKNYSTDPETFRKVWEYEVQQ